MKNLRRRFVRHFHLIFLFVHCLFRLFFPPIVEVLLFHLEKEIRENQALRLDRFQSFHPKYNVSLGDITYRGVTLDFELLFPIRMHHLVQRSGQVVHFYVSELESKVHGLMWYNLYKMC